MNKQKKHEDSMMLLLVCQCSIVPQDNQINQDQSVVLKT